MDNELPNLAPETIEDLCRHYREAERSLAMHFDMCDVRLAPIRTTATKPDERKINE